MRGLTWLAVATMTACGGATTVSTADAVAVAPTDDAASPQLGAAPDEPSVPPDASLTEPAGTAEPVAPELVDASVDLSESADVAAVDAAADAPADAAASDAEAGGWCPGWPPCPAGGTCQYAYQPPTPCYQAATSTAPEMRWCCGERAHACASDGMCFVTTFLGNQEAGTTVPGQPPSDF